MFLGLSEFQSIVDTLKRERPLMTSHIFWPFLTCLVQLYNIRTPLPTLISDVINGRSLSMISSMENDIFFRKDLIIVVGFYGANCAQCNYAFAMCN